jgi:nucleotide-binding universal stress UspA family protein
VVIRRVLVGVDGSEAARRACAWACELAAQAGADVLAVHAVGLLEHAHLEEPGRGTAVQPADLGLPSGALRVVEGDPVDALLQLAEELGADLLVVGSRGIGGRPELLLGSTSAQVAQRSTRPVVIVPATT